MCANARCSNIQVFKCSGMGESREPLDHEDVLAGYEVKE